MEHRLPSDQSRSENSEVALWSSGGAARASRAAENLDPSGEVAVPRDLGREAVIGGHQRGVPQQRRREIEAVVDGMAKLRGDAQRARQQDRQIDRFDRRIQEGLRPRAPRRQ
jgi:hypothetical protein